jgi:hypothetical protein
MTTIPSPPIQSNTAHIQRDALEALSSLLDRESLPIYACGRAYLGNLAMWRDRHDYESPLKKARGTQGTTTTEGGASLPSPSSPLKKSTAKMNLSFAALSVTNRRPINPATHPEVWLQWRAKITEWMFEFADSLGMQRNTAVASVAYLDLYSMYALFPDDFHKRTHCAEDEYEFSFGDRVGEMSGQVYCLAATTCFFMATKFYETGDSVFTIRHASMYTKFDESEIEGMERAIMHTLHFHLNPCTPVKFINEMLPLLLDDEESLCESGFKDEMGNHVVLRRNDCKLGTFRSTNWFPQTEVETRIIKQAVYMTDLVAYSSEFISVTSALPSKIALAAILEAATDNIVEGKDQLKFQARLRELSVKIVAFDVTPEVEKMRKNIRTMLHWNGCREEMRSMGGASPVTVLNVEVESTTTPAMKRDVGSLREGESAKNCSPAKKTKELTSRDTVNTVDHGTNPKDTKQNNEPSVSDATESTNTAEDEVPSEGRVWETWEVPKLRDLHDRQSSYCTCLDTIFDDEKPKATEKMPNVTH